MPIKTEIERRLRKRDCRRPKKHLEVESTCDDIHDDKYLKKMLKIAEASAC